MGSESHGEEDPRCKSHGTKKFKSFIVRNGVDHSKVPRKLRSVGYSYYTSPHIKRSIVYGDQPRNRLDLYLPKDSNGQKAVVAFVTGGAWIIG
ncbi:hypothetical protein ACHQM5_024732 [Ranunculus cassubicifolius]